MKTNYLDVIKQGEWLVDNLPLFKNKYPKKAYQFITPEFNKEFNVNFTERQVYARYQHYRERILHEEKAYKFSPLSRSYSKEELDAFYNWLINQQMIEKEDWEKKWFEITGKKLSYQSITQRMFQYGYKWGKTGKLITRSKSRNKHKVGDIIQRRNSKGYYVNWIKIKDFSDLNDEERKNHIKHKKDLEKSPCWKRNDRYVLEKKGFEIKSDEYVVHLNGDTLDDSIENLYITDNYHEYNALKVKGLCEIPSIVEASLETKKSIRKLEKELELL